MHTNSHEQREREFEGVGWEWARKSADILPGLNVLLFRALSKV